MDMLYYHVTCYFGNDTRVETIRFTSYRSVLDYLDNLYDQYNVTKVDIVLE